MNTDVPNLFEQLTNDESKRLIACTSVLLSTLPHKYNRQAFRNIKDRNDVLKRLNTCTNGKHTDPQTDAPLEVNYVELSSSEGFFCACYNKFCLRCFAGAMLTLKFNPEWKANCEHCKGIIALYSSYTIVRPVFAPESTKSPRQKVLPPSPPPEKKKTGRSGSKAPKAMEVS